MEGGTRLRLLSYNVHGLRDDPAALTAVVRAADPDVVVLQEAPRRLRWRPKSAALASGFGLVVAGGGLPALGNLVLTSLRVRVHGQRCLRYPLTPGRHMRGAVLVQCSVGRTRFVVAGSHLATDAAERPAQAAILRQALGEAGEPLLLGLDLNEAAVRGLDLDEAAVRGLDLNEAAVRGLDLDEAADGSAWRILTEGTGLRDAAAVAGRADQPTFPVASPRRRIDAILVDPRCEIIDYRVFDPPEARHASDHFPLLVDVLIPGS